MRKFEPSEKPVMCRVVRLTKDIIGYKKTKSVKGKSVIVTVLIPKGTLVHKGDMNKCRASQAIVKSIETVKSKAPVEKSYSLYTAVESEVPKSKEKAKDYVQTPWSPDTGFRMEYTAGKKLIPNAKFDTEATTCTTGIHFFETR